MASSTGRIDAQSEVIAFLRRPESYALDDNAEVETAETHISIVFLAGARAYKLKRAVKFPYLDFSTPEARHAACEAEVALNRRTAPQLYLEVREISRRSDGSIGWGGEGAPLDWVVVMRRFDQEQLFDRVARAGGLSTRRHVASSTVAHVPSDPTSARATWNPLSGKRWFKL